MRRAVPVSRPDGAPVTAFLVALAVLAAGGVAGVAGIVAGGRRRYARANQIVPGTPTHAPAAWAGAHSEEARLHRRLRDAVAGLRADPALADPARADVALLDARVALERHALAVDDRLVAVAALPEPAGGEPLATVAAAVGAVESAVAALVTAHPAPDGRAELDRAMAEVDERLALLAAARAELGEGPPPRPSTG